MQSKRSLATVLVGVSLIAAACGSGSDKKESTSSAAPTTAAGAATTVKDDTKSADTMTGDTKSGDAMTGDSKTGDTMTGDTKSGDAMTGDSKTGDTKPAAGGGGIDAAKAVVAQYQDPNQPIGITEPLKGKPEKQKIAWLECELESCKYETTGMKDATAALGWDLTVISMKSAEPGPAFQQAIDANVNFIAASGLAPALYADQAKAAADKGIKILSCFDTTPPDGPKSNIWTQCGDTSFVEKTGPLMADWAIVDSNGKANVLIVSIPDFAVLKAETDAYIAELKKNCPDCKYTELNITIPQLTGGEVPAAVASALQADSTLNYAFFSFGSLPSGVTATLSENGLLDKVKVYGQDFSAFDLEEMVKGTMGAWSADPKAYAAWLMVDAAARLSLGMELTEERAAASLPTFLVSDAKTAQEILDKQGGDWNPPNMAEQFKKLWGVG